MSGNGAFALRLCAVRMRLIVGLRRCGIPRWDRDDVVQQTLIELILRQAQLERLPQHELHAYAFRAAEGTLSKARRTAHRRRRREQQWAECEQEDPESVAAPEDLLARTQDIFLQLEVLSRLPDWLLTVIIACDVDGLPATELAAELELPVGTVKSHLRQARCQARALLKLCASQRGL